MKQYIVDAFTDKPFSGNPAAICVMDEWPSEDFMMNLAMENNLSEKLLSLPGRLYNATARGTETDCVSRSFAPSFGVAEDPVCGSAHCQIAPYWAGILGKNEIVAYQASKRGGYLHCELKDNGRIAISGEAVLVAISDIKADLS